MSLKSRENQGWPRSLAILCHCIGEAVSASLLSILLASVSAVAADQFGVIPPLESLLSEENYQKYLGKSEYKNRIDIFRRALSDEAGLLQLCIKQKTLGEANPVLLKIKALSYYAREEPTRRTANRKDFRSKQVKKLEIEVRKLLDSLHDFGLSVPLDYRGVFESVSAELKELRKQLLNEFFKP